VASGCVVAAGAGVPGAAAEVGVVSVDCDAAGGAVALGCCFALAKKWFEQKELPTGMLQKEASESFCGS